MTRTAPPPRRPALALAVALVLATAGAGLAWNPFAKAAPEPWGAAEWVPRARELGLEDRIPAFRAPLLPPGGKAAGPGALDAALRLALDPEEDWLLARGTLGSAADVRLLLRGTTGTLLARSDSALVFAPPFARASAAVECARRLRLPPGRPVLRSGVVLSPGDLLLLRALFEDALEAERLLPDAAPADLPGAPLAALRDRLLGPEAAGRLGRMPPRTAAALSALSAERFTAGRALEALRSRGLVRRRILGGVARYALSAAGSRLADCLFAPRDRLLVTRLPPDGAPAPLEAGLWAREAGFTLLALLRPDGSLEALPGVPEDPAAAVETLLDLLREFSFAGAAG